MLGLIQRVTSAGVAIDGESVARIDGGLLLLLAIQQADTRATGEKLLHRVLHYRVFDDVSAAAPERQRRMNLSLLDAGLALLVVSAFTLAAGTKKGLRPSFSSAAPPDKAEALYDAFVTAASQFVPTSAGRFGADMQVSLVNDGPVTFLLEA